MKITKSAFLGHQNSGGQADFLVNGRDPLSPPAPSPPHSENSAQTLNFVKPQVLLILKLIVSK